MSNGLSSKILWMILSHNILFPFWHMGGLGVDLFYNYFIFTVFTVFLPVLSLDHHVLAGTCLRITPRAAYSFKSNCHLFYGTLSVFVLMLLFWKKNKYTAKGLSIDRGIWNNFCINLFALITNFNLLHQLNGKWEWTILKMWISSVTRPAVRRLKPPFHFCQLLNLFEHLLYCINTQCKHFPVNWFNLYIHTNTVKTYRNVLLQSRSASFWTPHWGVNPNKSRAWSVSRSEPDIYWIKLKWK